MIRDTIVDTAQAVAYTCLYIYAFKLKHVKIFNQFVINVSKCMIFNPYGLQNY